MKQLNKFLFAGVLFSTGSVDASAMTASEIDTLGGFIKDCSNANGYFAACPNDYATGMLVYSPTDVSYDSIRSYNAQAAELSSFFDTIKSAGADETVDYLPSNYLSVLSDDHEYKKAHEILSRVRSVLLRTLMVQASPNSLADVYSELSAEIIGEDGLLAVGGSTITFDKLYEAFPNAKANALAGSYDNTLSSDILNFIAAQGYDGIAEFDEALQTIQQWLNVALFESLIKDNSYPIMIGKVAADTLEYANGDDLTVTALNELDTKFSEVMALYYSLDDQVPSNGLEGTHQVFNGYSFSQSIMSSIAAITPYEF